MPACVSVSSGSPDTVSDTLFVGVWHRRCRISGRLSRRSAACRRFRRVWWSWLCLLVHSCSAVRAVIKRICRHKKRFFASATDSSPIFDCFTVITRDIFSCPAGFRRLICALIPFISSNFSRSIVNTRHNRSASCKAFCTHHKSTSVTESHFRLATTKRTVFQFNLTHVPLPPVSPQTPLAHLPRTFLSPHCRSACRRSSSAAGS